jgi:catechol 2,3-dioxygenase-like lactoylglutathione lyase family enzyme
MLRTIDRVVLRVPQLKAAVKYYRDVLGLRVVREDAHVANLRLGGDHAPELVLHDDPDLPAEAVYFLVDDVRDLYKRRADLRLTFVNPPARSARGWRAAVKDPFGTVVHVLDKTAADGTGGVDDVRAGGALFAGVEHKFPAKAERLIKLYEKVGRTADDLPYTPHFETIFEPYAKLYGEIQPDRREVWRHLLNLRKAGKLPKLGEARSKPPNVEPEARERLRDLLGEEMGRRDRLPYSPRFERLVDDFNATLPRPLSPHLVWRLVATLAK